MKKDPWTNYTFEGYDEADGLGEGAWVLDAKARIVRWLPAEDLSPADPVMPDDTMHNTERGYQWHRHNDPDNWPLPADDPCGCRAAHAASEKFRAWEARQENGAA